MRKSPHPPTLRVGPSLPRVQGRGFTPSLTRGGGLGWGLAARATGGIA
jgi:hypothetical protein